MEHPWSTKCKRTEVEGSESGGVCFLTGIGVPYREVLYLDGPHFHHTVYNFYKCALQLGQLQNYILVAPKKKICFWYMLRPISLSPGTKAFFSQLHLSVVILWSTVVWTQLVMPHATEITDQANCSAKSCKNSSFKHAGVKPYHKGVQQEYSD